MTLYWPDNISTNIFLKDYWQKKPLLIRNGFSNKIDFISPDELAGLACEEEIESRIITGDHKSKNWTLTHGPFKEDYFSCLPESAWTLLVQDVDKHLPEAAAFLKHFDFIPKWRIDDLMISYAEDQGSVGPHTDSYDVFLVQLQGERLWKLSDQQVTDDDLLEDCDVRVLKEFETSHEWLMKPGDVLYLPPGIPHWGIAQGECMTGSIGFISPKQDQMFHSWADFIAERLPTHKHYSDPDISATSEPYLVDSKAIEKAAALLRETIDTDSSTLTRWFGQMVSASKPHLEIEKPHSLLLENELKDYLVNTDLIKHPYLRMFYSQSHNNLVLLFAQGESYELASDNNDFVRFLCQNHEFLKGSLSAWMDNQDCTQCLLSLINQGYLMPYDED